jgi:CBS domain-containing protein
MAREGEDVVSKVMSRTVRTSTKEKKIGDAVKIMAGRDIGSVVITAGGKPVGIVTERDVVRELAHGGTASLRKSLGSIASMPVVTVTPTTEIWEAFATMLKEGIRRLPVVEGGKVVGIVTERDLLKWVVGVFYEPNVPRDIRKLLTQN